MAFNWYGYLSDNLTTYAIKLNTLEAAAGGFGAPIAPPPANPAWPWKPKDLRHVSGTNNVTGKGARLKVKTNVLGLYTSGGTWTNTLGQLCTAKGAEGERRPGNHLV